MPKIYYMGPKKGVLRIFSPLKIRRLRPGLNLRTWVLKGSTLPLDYRRNNYIYIYIYIYIIKINNVWRKFVKLPS